MTVLAREFSTIGPCIVLGEVTKRTTKTLFFRNREGKIEKRSGHRVDCGLVHIDPCPSCRDHERTQYPNGYED